MHPKIGEVDFCRLRVAIGGGAAVLPTTSAKWKALTGKDILEGYGLSETSPVLTLNPTDDGRFSATVGLPFPSTDIKLLDADDKEAAIGEPGEICAKGPQVMQGYWQKPQANAAAFTADGYFRTGDIGVFDAKGFLKIVDRKKDMIIVSGFNVYPNEVEAVAAACAGRRRMRLRRQTGREDRRGGPAVRRQGAGRDAHRRRRDRALPAAARGLQGAEGGALPRRVAEVERGQDPAQGSARNPVRRRHHGDPRLLHGDGPTVRRPRARRHRTGSRSTRTASITSRPAPATGSGSMSTSSAPGARARSAARSRMAISRSRWSRAMVMELGVIPTGRRDRAQLRAGQSPLHRAGQGGRARAHARACSRPSRRTEAHAAQAASTLEIEGEAKPALVAEVLCMLIGKTRCSRS